MDKTEQVREIVYKLITVFQPRSLSTSEIDAVVEQINAFYNQPVDHVAESSQRVMLHAERLAVHPHEHNTTDEE